MLADELVLSTEAIVEFFDADVKAASHSNAIKTLAGEELGLALLCHYLRGRGDQAELLHRKCNSGTRNGRRLDGWVRHRPVGRATDIHYQVEVKTWSIHGIGGNKTPIPRTVSAPDLTELSAAHWRMHYWDEEIEQFRPDSLKKVLQQMKPIDTAATRLPLACLWDPVHPVGNVTPFFEVPLVSNDWANSLWVFSMSHYLRAFPAGTMLQLHLPKVAARLRYLMKLFPGFQLTIQGASPQ